MPVSRQKIPGFTNTQLKVIAMIAMVIDHGAVALVAPMVTEAGSAWYVCYWVMRSIGRVAFPLFAFLLAEGAYHTGNPWKYLGRLCLFAVISEIPFDLVVGNTVFYPQAQNVFITLALALATLMGIKGSAGRPLVQVLVGVGGCLAAEILKSDYGMLGVLLVLIYWTFREQKSYRRMGELVVFFFLMPGFWGLSYLLVLPLTEGYNGQRGTRLGFWAYGFYPAHLMILKMIQYLVFW